MTTLRIVEDAPGDPPGVFLSIGEARFLLALLNECWATKGSIANSIYCYEEAVQIADKLKQAVLGDPHR